VVAHDLERGRRVPERASDLRGLALLDEEGPKRLVLPLLGGARLREEAAAFAYRLRCADRHVATVILRDLSVKQKRQAVSIHVLLPVIFVESLADNPASRQDPARQDRVTPPYEDPSNTAISAPVLISRSASSSSRRPASSRTRRSKHGRPPPVSALGKLIEIDHLPVRVDAEHCAHGCCD